MNFFTKLKCLLQMHEGEWTTDGLSGCWQRYRCIYCEITEQRVRHGRPISGRTLRTLWNYYCERCGEYLGIEWVYVDD